MNEEEEENEDSEEENSFLSGFGELHSDTDEPANIDSNIKEQKIVAKENAKTPQEDYDTKEDTTGRFII